MVYSENTEELNIWVIVMKTLKAILRHPYIMNGWQYSGGGVWGGGVGGVSIFDEDLD